MSVCQSACQVDGQGMLLEVLPSSGKTKCMHSLQLVEKKESDGVLVIITACTKCGQTFESRPIVKETATDEKPLLME